MVCSNLRSAWPEDFAPSVISVSLAYLKAVGLHLDLPSLKPSPLPTQNSE